MIVGPSLAQASVGTTPTLPCAQPDGRVTALALSAGTLFVGGSFTHVKDASGASQPRSMLAAIDTATCDLLPWRADADAAVYALTVANGALYAGGAFRHVGGLSRSRIAAVDTASGAVLPFNPVADKPVLSLTASETTLYAGGKFAHMGGRARLKLAGFELDTGALDPTWTPKTKGSVDALAVGADGRDVYVGGGFTELNGDHSLPYLGAVDAVSGATDPAFVPNAIFPILALAADSRGLYAGGGGSGGHLVIWTLDGSLQQPIYQTDGGVQNVSVDGDSLYAGGHFVNYCEGNTGAGHPFACDVNVHQPKLFEVSLSTGQLTAWTPAPNSARGVFASVVDPATHALWVGGDFTRIGTQPVAHLAQLR
jgi:hypothetical protein